MSGVMQTAIGKAKQTIQEQSKRVVNREILRARLSLVALEQALACSVSWVPELVS